MATKTCKANIENWKAIIKEAKLPTGKKINGCITGSCMLEADFDMWQSVPDIDVFTYTERDMIRAIDLLTMKYGLKYGTDDETIHWMQEVQKDSWLMEDKKNKSSVTGITLATIKLHTDDGVIVNISCKKGCNDLAAVLCSFDMTCIMKGYDIRGEFGMDLREQWCDKATAVANPIRKSKVDLDLVRTAYWIRQFDRVIKYWQRGIDTRPIARWYVEEIQMVLDRGNIWTSEGSAEFYNKFAEEFVEMRERISMWLKDKED